MTDELGEGVRLCAHPVLRCGLQAGGIPLPAGFFCRRQIRFLPSEKLACAGRKSDPAVQFLHLSLRMCILNLKMCIFRLKICILSLKMDFLVA